MKNLNLKKVLAILKLIAVYYLSVKMVCFAIPKILYMQFRVLHWQSYIPLVEISKTQHMWSFFGRSYNYNLFIGVTEFLIGALILFNRTRLIALLLALGVCVNILVLNIEFEVHFAISHITQDLILVLLLLLGYRKDLYKFFIVSKGRFDNSPVEKKGKFARFFPYAFLTLLTVGYFSFSVYMKSKYTGDENMTGSYKIKTIKINDSIIIPDKGNFGKEPMLFVEHNQQFVLSIEDTTYMGRYIFEKDSIRVYLDNSTKFGMKSLIGSWKNNSIQGKIDGNQSFEMTYKRNDVNQDYLNELYK